MPGSWVCAHCYITRVPPRFAVRSALCTFFSVDRNLWGFLMGLFGGAFSGAF